MNIYHFINSRDIAEHLQKINYPFSALEAAWLVWQSKNRTLDEKRQAWRDIMEQMPDCPIPAGMYDMPQASLHRFLGQFMDLQDLLLSAFYQHEGHAVYSYRFYCVGEDNWCEDSRFFANFDEAHSAFTEDLDLDPSFVEFVKTYIGAEGKRIFVRMTADKALVHIDENGYLTDEKDHEHFQCGFQNMWFSFPVPFEKGDILETVQGKYRLPSFMGGIYVLSTICGDGSHMTGYLAGSATTVTHECIHNYMDCELVRRDLKHDDRMLIPISKYLKDEIDLGLLLGAQRILLCENEAETARTLLNCAQDCFRLAEPAD